MRGRLDLEISVACGGIVIGLVILFAGLVLLPWLERSFGV